MQQLEGPIGVFDSGYGGLTILRQLREQLPQYDFIYLGDNARSPYGSRSMSVVYQFTKEAVYRLFDLGCPLVILACNTASAKALRQIQQQDLPTLEDGAMRRRVLGIIRPTVECIDTLTSTKHVGILATEGTVSSESYVTEIHKLYPEVTVVQEACPLWVPIVETGESDSPGTDYFVRKHLERLLAQDDKIDTIILGCTHYPILMPKIQRLLTPSIRVVAQGELVARSLSDYLIRHPEMATQLSRGGSIRYYTTEQPERFSRTASIFFDTPISVEHLSLSQS
ncbi:MAG: glutamate racemase [Porphyromonas sp.]|uniref:glutamate racemase n=1 Tax=Porphyromonas sp. TaxID=1924944 RepID=UPI001A415608|nr:glutamate racemase [Porphyromonas sp.]MBL6452642.1 glutamate racemase [Porphyromonas sp.]